MRRWLGVGVALAVLAAALWYASGGNRERSARHLTADETGDERDSAQRLFPVNALLSAPLPAPRGSLHIRGTVVGPEGEIVPGAVVVATSPTPDERLSELPCQCDKLCETKLLQCDCGMVAQQLVELVAERRGEAPPLARTTSDAQGHFSLEGLEAGRYALWADGPFGTTLQQDVETGAEGVVLRVGRGMTLSGLLTQDDGQPISGALVTALFDEHSRFFDTLSDAEGRWRLGPLPRGNYHLVFTHEGLLPEHVKVRQATDREQQVTLHRALRLSGRVVREGSPVSGARVHAEGEHRKLATTTDEQGRFTFEGLRPGRYELSTTHAGLDATGRATLAPGVDATELLLELGVAARLTGTVRDTAGRPIADATVSAWLSQAGYGSSFKKTRTASDGTYVLGPVEPGRYRFQVDAPRYVSLEPQEKRVEGNLAQDFVLEDAVMVEGRVVGDNGEPLDGVKLQLKAPADGTPNEEFDEVSSKQDGTFALAAPKPGGYQLRAVHTDFVPTTQPIQAPSSRVQVVLSAGAEVTGDVVDETGAPISGADVSLMPAQETEVQQKDTTTNAQGHFVLEGVVAGKYNVSATESAGPEFRSASRPIEVRGKESAQVRLQFLEGLPLAGVVVDGAGRPVPEAHLRAYPVGERVRTSEAPAYSAGTNGHVTDANGRFQLRHLATGRYAVFALKDGYLFDAKASGGTPSDAESDDSEVVVQAGTTDLRLVMTQLSSIRGRVVRTDGTPVTRFQLNDEEVTDPRGAFTRPIYQSREAEVRLVFSAPKLASTSRELKVKQGVDIELGDVVLEAGRELRGKVVDAATGGPVPGALVDLGDEPVDSPRHVYISERMGAVRTLRDGTFTLRNLEERPRTLVVMHPEYMPKRMALEARQTEVVVALDTGATLRGTVRTSGKRWPGVSIQALKGSLEKFTNAAGGAYEFRGLPAGEYIIHVTSRHPIGEQTFHAQRVVLPAQGVVTVDFEEVRSGATLRLNLVGESSLVGVILVPGSIPLPDSFDALRLLVVQGHIPATPDENGPYTFRLLPAGTYTLLVVRRADENVELYREELELPAQGEVSRDVVPGWERRPYRQFVGDALD